MPDFVWAATDASLERQLRRLESDLGQLGEREGDLVIGGMHRGHELEDLRKRVAALDTPGEGADAGRAGDQPPAGDLHAMIEEIEPLERELTLHREGERAAHEAEARLARDAGRLYARVDRVLDRLEGAPDGLWKRAVRLASETDRLVARSRVASDPGEEARGIDGLLERLAALRARWERGGQ